MKTTRIVVPAGLYARLLAAGFETTVPASEPAPALPRPQVLRAGARATMTARNARRLAKKRSK